ncbi:YeeE/YedE thiosulfate transporter family protein [Lacrimispora aerotolerans]|uniref:YeeE/YedE thiosulfate transporter family protein n=1 Tax=Lacrimispora aerotolerans TaxID=36832 RepID=UPI0004792E31|nr:YeeE/YedE thiosulfate transporter family protein [Lacrimispora aerotolerans]
MKEFFIKLGENPIYKKLLKEPLTYVAGAVLLSVFQIAHFTVFEKGWGVTSTFAVWGTWVYQALGGDASGWAYYAPEKMQKELYTSFLVDGGSIRNLGIIIGALAATLFASQFKIKKIKTLRQVVAAVLGGLLMGYGARLANGCNIGALFTAIASFSLSGWVFGAFLLVGAFIGSKLLAKYFM